MKKQYHADKYIFWFCLILAAALFIGSFFCPPMGEIHHSVLIAFGEILTFSGSLIGIDYKYRYKE